MNGYCLRVLYRAIASISLKLCGMVEEPARDALFDAIHVIDVARRLDFDALEKFDELLANISRRFHRSLLHKILITPLHTEICIAPGVVYV